MCTGVRINIDKCLSLLKERTSRLGVVIEAAKTIIGKIDQQSLLAYYGMKSDIRPNAAAVKR